MRTIKAILDQQTETFGIELYKIPLDDTDTPTYCTINRADFDLLNDLGCSDVWWLNKDKQVVCWGGMSKRALVIARLILDAIGGEIVKYADGSTLNLRRTNLRIVKRGRGSKNRERDFLRMGETEAQGRNLKPRCKIVREYFVKRNGINHNTSAISAVGMNFDIPDKFKDKNYYIGSRPMAAEFVSAGRGLARQVGNI